MTLTLNISAQSSFGLMGYWGFNQDSPVMINSFENNPGNFSLLKDWGLSLSYGGEFSNNISSNLYLISLSKRIGSHNLSARYTPGYQKEFIFSTNESIILADSTSQSLESRFIYKELFGFGYSFKFSSTLSAGFTLRYFNQEFNNEIVQPVLSDTLYYLERETETEKLNFWKADIGITYQLFENLSLNLASINLLNFGEKSEDAENEPYEIKREKGALAGFTYNPFPNFDLSILYESNSSFQFGFNNIFDISGNKFGFGLTTFHDKYQSPFIAGVITAVAFTSKLFGISISGIKYFSDRNKTHSFTDFKEKGFHNIINNRYSFDKAILSFSFTLNTIAERSIELIGVEILTDIFPTLSNNYIDHPFAVGTVINLTAKPVIVKPASKIEGITEEKIQSPNVTISPKDTVKIKFYTIIPERYSGEKTQITYADFYVTALSDEPDDEFQRAILVNGINAWDGKASNLKYFIKKDLDFSMNYSKNILSRHKEDLDTIPYSLSNFYKSKIIFNAFIKELIYTADPRASAEYVQFPHETLKVKGGDCDDLSVCYSSLLESIGIETALVDYKSDKEIKHVNVLVNTNLSPAQARLITQNDSKFFLKKNNKGEDEIWIPVESTSLKDFDSAWKIGSEKFHQEGIEELGLVKGEVEIIEVF